MERRVGLGPVTVAEMVQRETGPASEYTALPLVPPGAGQLRAKGSDLGVKGPGEELFVIGDHGGIKDPTAANAVSNAMRNDHTGKPVDLVYSVGDVVYFNGDASEYGPQFYEQYGHLPVPILAVPGNHDGDTSDDPSRAPLDTFMANFCAPSAGPPPADSQLEYGRDTQTQPYCYWTLQLAALTIIGLYSNVPAGGHIDQAQADWLAGELKDAPLDRPLIVALHHPPYSADAHHGGSARMGGVLDGAFKAIGRWPELVLAGHVHNYQRFTRRVNVGDGTVKSVPYVVIGNSGYHNLHEMAGGATVGMQVTPDTELDAWCDLHDGLFGYLRLSVAGRDLGVSFNAVDVKASTVQLGRDKFTVSAGLVQSGTR